MHAFEEVWNSAAQPQYHFYTSQRNERSYTRDSGSATPVSGAAGSHKPSKLSLLLRTRRGSRQQMKRKPVVGFSRKHFSQMAVAEAISADSQTLPVSSLLPSHSAATFPSLLHGYQASITGHGLPSANSRLPMQFCAAPPTTFPGSKLQIFCSGQHGSTPPFDCGVVPGLEYETAYRAVPQTFNALLNSSSGSSHPTGQKQLQGAGVGLQAIQIVHSSHPCMYSTQISTRELCILPQASNCPEQDSLFTLASSQATHRPQLTQSRIQLLSRLTERVSVTASIGACPPPPPRRPQPQHLHSLAVNEFPPGGRPVQSNTELLNKLLQLSATADTASSY